MITESIKNLIQKACSDLHFEVGEIALEHPENADHGDYSTNVALVLAKKLSKNPHKVAEAIVSEIRKIQDTKYKIQAVEVAGLGFINFFLSREYLVQELSRIAKQKDRYGARLRVVADSISAWQGKKIIVEYSSPNIAKSFGIGHLRSTIIGQAIYNLYAFLG